MKTILETIGNTPLVRLRRCAPVSGAELWLKLEYRNPTGSMKDRMALAMIEGAERDGLISAGDTVVEYTGGSTGPAVALVCRAKGYRAVIVMADCFTEERFQLTRALGAEVEVVRSVEGRPKVTPQDIANMVERAGELAAEPGHYATDQFNNPYIVPDHRARLGRQIWDQGWARHSVLPRVGNRELAAWRVRGAQTSGRVHPGSRAGGICGNQRRSGRNVPHARLGRIRDAALGRRPRRSRRGDPRRRGARDDTPAGRRRGDLGGNLNGRPARAGTKLARS